jgi:cytochrome c-type biogenesis protein CcmF
MADLGQLLMLAALGFAVYSVFASFIGAQRRLPELVQSGRSAAWGTIILSVTAFGILEALLIAQDFSVDYVYRQTAIGQPIFYTITGVWGGQEGSLMWWLCLLCLFTAAALWTHREDNPTFMAYVTGVLMVISAFFSILSLHPLSPP